MTSAEQMAAALSLIGPHFFRDGLVVAYIENFFCSGEMFSVDIVSASYNNIEIIIEDRMNWSNYELLGEDPKIFAYRLIGDRIRGLANGTI